MNSGIYYDKAGELVAYGNISSGAWYCFACKHIPRNELRDPDNTSFNLMPERSRTGTRWDKSVRRYFNVTKAGKFRFHPRATARLGDHDDRKELLEGQQYRRDHPYDNRPYPNGDEFIRNVLRTRVVL